ncbi:MAG: hypothetical protein WCH97_06960 [Actinomycetes bacterium]
MSQLLKAKRGGAIPSAIFFTIFFLLLSILGSIYLSIGVGNPVNKVIDGLLSSSTFKHDAGDYFVSKTLETASGDERALLTEKGPQISATVTTILSNSLFKDVVESISDIAYHYYVGGAKAQQSVDVKPVLQLALPILESVDPQFSKLSKELDKIKPIKLQPQTNGPDVAQMKSYFTLGVWLLLALSLLTLLLYLRFANSLRAALRVPGIVILSVGAFLITLNIVAAAIVKHQAATATESLAREAIPIAAHTLISPIMTNGVAELLFGLVLLALSFLKRMRANSLNPRI